MKNIRIGIPRALLYYSYACFWKAFFEKLGFETIVSPETTAGILKDGIRRSVSDLCLPVKTFMGHIDCLKDSVDYLFIPRYVSVEQDSYMCPKIIGLPDMTKACFRRLPSVIDPLMHMKKEGEKAFLSFSRQIADALLLNRKEVEEAIPNTADAVTGFPDRPNISSVPLFNKGKDDLFSDSRVNIGVIGRSYILFDKHISKNLFRTLSDLNANPVYIHPSGDEIKEAMTIIPKWVYWNMGKEVVASAHYFFKNPDIDGVINVCSAACGPDSFTGDLIRKRLNQRDKPFMSLSIDEHSSDAGIHTRVEAFIDMLGKMTV
ncbi:MAG: acyl-CoA dehydratase activase-related protein [Nitrospirota bacterium]